MEYGKIFRDMHGKTPLEKEITDDLLAIWLPEDEMPTPLTDTLSSKPDITTAEIVALCKKFEQRLTTLRVTTVTLLKAITAEDSTHSPTTTAFIGEFANYLFSNHIDQ